MHSFRRIAAVLVLALALMAVVSPAIATESQTETDPGTTETTVATEPTFVGGDEPAVVIPPDSLAEEEVEQPWTSRFIYPTIVVVTILLIIGLVWGYFHFIRNRYTVVSDT